MIESFQVTQQLLKQMLLLAASITVNSVLTMADENLLVDRNAVGLSPKEFSFLRLVGMQKFLSIPLSLEPSCA